MSGITTHVLDVSVGRPAANLCVQLEIFRDGAFRELAHGTTNMDGRIVDWMRGMKLEEGHYQISFATAGYFDAIGCREYFYPEVKVSFRITDSSGHYHVPLLLSPFGYSTYRGS